MCGTLFWLLDGGEFVDVRVGDGFDGVLQNQAHTDGRQSQLSFLTGLSFRATVRA